MNFLLFLTLIVLLKLSADAVTAPRRTTAQVVNGVLAALTLVVLVLQVA